MISSLPGKASRMLVESRGLLSESICFLEAEPGTNEISKDANLVVLFISLQVRSLFKLNYSDYIRTSDGGNGNHSVSLPIILIKIKVDRMIPSSYISSLLVSIL